MNGKQPKPPEPVCSGCGKRTQKECGRVECANRKHHTADLDWRAFESSPGSGCYSRKPNLERD